jgi:hypothetical protein
MIDLDSPISYRVSPAITNDALNALFASACPDNVWSDFEPVLSRSLAYVCAYQQDRLIGFVNLAWDGGMHAFLLDTTVHPSFDAMGSAASWWHAPRRPPASAGSPGCMWTTSRTSNRSIAAAASDILQLGCSGWSRQCDARQRAFIQAHSSERCR